MTIRSMLLSLVLLIGGWLTVVAVVTVITDAAPASVVLFPSDDLLRDLNADTAVLSTSAISVTLASKQSGFVQSLYQKGAWLVLPAGLRGCF